MEILDKLCSILTEKYVLTGKATEPWNHDWTNSYHWEPLAVVRPSNTSQVQSVARACYASKVAMVPVGGNTGLTGGTKAQDAIMISLDRMNTIREIKPNAQVAIVESGVILEKIHQAVSSHGLIFPLFFGARGSAMIGGNLSTNAGGSNVLRYGNTRDLCLGLEVVLPDGRLMNLMSELRKDNTGLDLKNIFIGSEGTLGIITAAVLRLHRKPLAYVTAMVGLKDLKNSLYLLNRLQNETNTGVEAFEFMPRRYIERYLEKKEGALEPFDRPHEINILVEVATTRVSDLEQDHSGAPKLRSIVEEALSDMIKDGSAQDAVIAQNEAQRRVMWERREAAAEITLGIPGSIDTDVAVPLDDVSKFLEQVSVRVKEIDPNGEELYISHLGDGNLHYNFYPSDTSGALKEPIIKVIEDVVLGLNGSFSAEHGIGLSKKNSMSRRKDPIALEMMSAIKTAFDPKNLMNPGKVYPD
ncbi:MAG: FAD-binding oxidoreductase [Rhodospirillales bacterium]|nr:FAD-binding oxidoreductase [Rhodospirillales bacterium]